MRFLPMRDDGIDPWVWHLLGVVTLVAVAILRSPGLLIAQTGGTSTFDHSCADCHMRDHDTNSGSLEPSESRLATVAMQALIPGLDLKSANCLECHSTQEQRALRNAEGLAGSVPLDDGRYLGFAPPNSHPLGSERRPGPMGAEEPLPSPFDRARDDRILGPFPGSNGISETVTCAVCHDPHMYDLRLGVSDDERTVCLSCHDPTYFAFRAHVTPTCGDCHQQHDAPGRFLIREIDSETLCSACHEGSGRMAMNRVDPSLHGPPTHADLRVGACSDCHKIHGDPGGG